MPEVYVCVDEWYPFYELEETGYKDTQVVMHLTDEEWEEYKSVMSNLLLWQHRIGEAEENASH